MTPAISMKRCQKILEQESYRLDSLEITVLEELRWGVLCGKKCYHVVRKELIPIVGRYLLSSYTSGQGNYPKEPNALV